MLTKPEKTLQKTKKRLLISYANSFLLLYQLLSLYNNIGFVPLANIDVDIVAPVKIVCHWIIFVEEVGTFHCGFEFCEELLGFAFVVIMNPIGINLITVSIKVDGSFPASDNQTRMIANADATLDLVLFQHCLDGGCQLCFHFLADVCHFKLLFTYYAIIIAKW